MEKEKRFYVEEEQRQRLKEKYKAVDTNGIINRLLEYFEKKPFKDDERIIFNAQIQEYIKIFNRNPINEETKEEPIELEEKIEPEKIQFLLGENYGKIVKILREYIDIEEKYYSLIAIWIIGTYVYESFETYPYLFINAMKGSGKSKLLKLIKALSNNGDLVTSVREAVLFRTAKGKTLCIDEFEGLNKKENAPLRELLNACYKKGMHVQRMKKVKEQQVVEDFEPYTPICMANIWGMEEVLGDRCITIILENSNNDRVTRLVEDFNQNLDVKVIKANFLPILVYMCSYFSQKTHIEEWNNYIKYKYPTPSTLTTYTTQTTLTTQLHYTMDNEEFFNIIDGTGINGRNLELIFPLLIISKFIHNDLFLNILEITKGLTKERKEEEMTESKDIAFIEFISRQYSEDYILIKKLTNNFRLFLGDDAVTDEPWLNTKWLGRALKRLVLIVDKRRVGEGIEVRLNINKAKEQIKLFKQKK